MDRWIFVFFVNLPPLVSRTYLMDIPDLQGLLILMPADHFRHHHLTHRQFRFHLYVFSYLMASLYPLLLLLLLDPVTSLTSEEAHTPFRRSTFEPRNGEQITPSQPCPFNNFPYGSGIFPGVPPPIERDPEYAREQVSHRYGPRNTGVHNALPSQSVDSSPDPTQIVQRPLSRNDILPSPSSTRPTRTTDEEAHIPSQPSNFEPLSREQVPPSQPCPFNNFRYGTGIFPGVPPPIGRDIEYEREQTLLRCRPKRPPPPAAHSTPHHPPVRDLPESYDKCFDGIF
ncbi:unnamed protein product [Rodentolepis nana]|uniref:Transmembrane protein n=1 Tax=Rodentolepis nana TaxID=102285 RepID=A0A0R3TTG8_RODNA|nr:unnamed protein product [Rodentolepis nana]